MLKHIKSFVNVANLSLTKCFVCKESNFIKPGYAAFTRRVSLTQHNLQFQIVISPRPSPRARYNYRPMPEGQVLLFAGILSFLGLAEKEDKTDVMITTMKRAILLIQNGENKKAEQMLHIALKLAQEQHNKDAITYIYDLMANLAFEQGEVDKAEKLFVSVMQRSLSTGITQDDNKIMHMSLKLANIYNIKNDYKKAEEGFKFCSQGLEKKVEKGANDDDTLLLLAMTLDWYGRFLLERDRPDEAFQCFEKAYNLSIKINGTIHEQSVVLLNDLGTICCLKGDNTGALKYLCKAVEVGKHLPDMEDLGSVYVNLGNVYMKQGLYAESKKKL